MSEVLAAASIIIFMIVIAIIYFAMSSSKPDIAVVKNDNTNVADATTVVTTSSPVAVLTFPVKLKMPEFPANPPIQADLPQKNTSQIQSLYQGTLNYINSAYSIYVDAYIKISNQYNASIDKIEKADLVGKTNVLAVNFNQNSTRALEQYNAQAIPYGYMAVQLYGDYSQVVVKKEVQAAQPIIMGAPVSFNYVARANVAAVTVPSAARGVPSTAPPATGAVPSSSPSTAPPATGAVPSSSPSRAPPATGAVPSSSPSRAPATGPIAISAR